MSMQLMDLFEDRRAFGEVFDVFIVDNIYQSANSAVVVYDKFGRKTREIFANVIPKVAEELDGYSPQLVAEGLLSFMYDNKFVRSTDKLVVTAFPFAGLRIANLVRFVEGTLPIICVANGVVVADTVTPVRLPANANHVKLGHELMALRELFKEGYRPHKLAQLIERWKHHIEGVDIVPNTGDQLASSLERLAALYDRSFEYGPEGVGIVYKIGGSITVKFRKANKMVLVDDSNGGHKEFDLVAQGADLIGHVNEVITNVPTGGTRGIHDCTGMAAIDGIKDRLANCEKLTAFVSGRNEFTVVRNDNQKHVGILVDAKDRAGQTYLIFVLEKNGGYLRVELRTDDRLGVSDFYNVIAGYMEINNVAS